MLNERLHTLICTLGIKKGAFAERINFSQAYISMILSGAKTNPSDRFYDSVKREFQVNIQWLRDGLGEMFEMNDTGLSPLEKNLMSKYNALPLSERKIVDEVVDALLIKHLQERKEKQE